MKLAKLIVEVRPTDPPGLLRVNTTVARALGVNVGEGEGQEKPAEFDPRYSIRNKEGR